MKGGVYRGKAKVKKSVGIEGTEEVSEEKRCVEKKHSESW